MAMNSLGDQLDDIRLRVRVPGTEIYGELRRHDRITLSFGPDTYRCQCERHLEHYLASLARLLHTAWLRAHRAALAGSFIGTGGAADQNGRDFLAARAELMAGGMSVDRRIAITAVDLQDVRVDIADGTLRACDEHEFTTSVAQAAAALLADHRAKVRDLKLQFFG